MIARCAASRGRDPHEQVMLHDEARPRCTRGNCPCAASASGSRMNGICRMDGGEVSQPTYKPGDSVRTPEHADGTIVTVNLGPIRGRTWREVSYTVCMFATGRHVVYYESQLIRRGG
jgi:hypothetical protein